MRHHAEQGVDGMKWTSRPVTLLVAAVIASLIGVPQAQAIIDTERPTTIFRERTPYLVGLNLDDSHWCGATLVSQSTVLTAAHCLDQRSQGKIFLGLFDRSRPMLTNTQIVSVTKSDWVVHPGFDRLTLLNDIAVIKLPAHAKMNENVMAVQLGTAKALDSGPVTVSGWGAGRYLDDDSISSTLSEAVTVSLTPLNTCKNWFGARITPTMICAVSGSTYIKGFCSGDDGGPAISPVDRRLIGIISFTGERCHSRTPRVMTRVDSYRTWICQNIKIGEFIEGCPRGQNTATQASVKYR
ncbi:serine protease [Actinokineospora sp. 24-640]